MGNNPIDGAPMRLGPYRRSPQISRVLGIVQWVYVWRCRERLLPKAHVFIVAIFLGHSRPRCALFPAYGALLFHQIGPGYVFNSSELLLPIRFFCKSAHFASPQAGMSAPGIMEPTLSVGDP